MKIRYWLIGILTFSLWGVQAQYRTFDAYALGASYGFFKSDFGERYNFDTNISNNAYQFNGKLYFNFYPYHWQITHHFRFFATVDFIYGDLQHKGRYASKDTETSKRLRAMTANPIIGGLGLGTEFWLQDLSYFSFTRLFGIYRFNPYLGLSFTGYYYKPNVKSSLGDINNPAEQPAILHPRFVGHVFNSGGFTYAVTGSFGVGYQLNDYIHLYWENRFTWFPSDKVDGLDVNDGPDKYADWLFTPLIGIEYTFQ